MTVARGDRIPGAANPGRSTKARDAMNEKLKSDIGEWIVRSTLDGTTGVDILAGVCERLNAAGHVAGASRDRLPICSIRRSIRSARCWNRGAGLPSRPPRATDDEDVNDEWLQSPFYRLFEGGERTLRRRLDATYHRGEFPLLDAFQDRGVTDYAGVSRADRRKSAFRRFEGGVRVVDDRCPRAVSPTISCTCSARLMPTLTLAAMLRIAHRTARTMLTTYLGHDAALRVLGGNIVRGRAEPIRAVVWFSDLVGFTRISDKVGADGMLALLNDYAEAQVEAIEAHGGHVLKFIGDGMLAIFPDDRGRGRLRERARRRGRTASSHRRAQRATHRGRTCR